MAEQKVIMTDPRQEDYFYQEAIKTLRTNIQFAGMDVKTILFTSCYPNEEENTGSFVTYWNMSNQLRTILNKSIRLMKQETQKKTLTQRVFQKWGKYQKEETIRNQQIAKLSTQAVQYITALKMAGIPMDYWSSDAMNWILVRWGQKQSVDYHTLFSRYDDYVEETLSNSEKIRLKNQNKRFHHNLKKLLSYALKA